MQQEENERICKALQLEAARSKAHAARGHKAAAELKEAKTQLHNTRMQVGGKAKIPNSSQNHASDDLVYIPGQDCCGAHCPA